jgi:hypothetical protein
MSHKTPRVTTGVSVGEPVFVGPLATEWGGLSSTDVSTLLAPVGSALPVPSAQCRAVWEGLDEATLTPIAMRAERDLLEPWPVPRAQQYARYHRDGNREEYEQVVLARQCRLSRAAVMAAVTLADHWTDEVTDGVTLLSEQSSWCWPAHDDTRARHGSVLPTVDDPYLDLGAGEVVAQLAWIDHLLGDTLDRRSPGLRARMRYETRRRVLEPFMRRRDWHWLGLDGHVHNWNPWIHGNILVAALQLADSRSERAEIVRLTIEGLDRYVGALPDDGAVDEGYGYWWNGACRALEALDVLAHATGGALDAAAVPALRATVGFPVAMHLGGDWYLNVADGQARPPHDQPWHALHRAARRVGDHVAAAHAASYRARGPVADERGGLGRLLRAVTDPVWTGAVPASPQFARDVWLPSVQLLVARRTAGSCAGLTLAIKGGHNGEHHNHNDVGSFVVALNGVPVVVDAGRPTYTAQTFGPDRYSLWTMQSAWHSTPQLGGTQQGVGREHRARDVAVETGDGASTLVLDLAAAYPGHGADRWWRTARLDRTTGRVLVTDEWQLAESAGTSFVHLILAGDLTAATGSARINALDGAGSLELTWTPPTDAVLTDQALGDPMLSDVWGSHLTRISIPVGGRAGHLEVQAREIT